MSESNAPAATIPVEREFWTIEPRREGVLVRLREFWRYRKILSFFAVRTLKRTYEGTLLGRIWMLRPIFPIAITAFVFGTLLGMSGGTVPYFLFFLAGMSVWMLFEQSALWITRSLDMNKGIITKVYIPRLVVPISSSVPAIVYFVVFVVLLLLGCIYYLIAEGRWYLVMGPGLLVAVFAAAMCVVQALAIGLFTSVWQTKVREVRFTLRYVLQFWHYLTPVIYPMSMVPAKYRFIMFVNPLAAYVEAYKWGVLGIGEVDPAHMALAVTMTLASLFAGVWYFTREESKAIDNL